MPKSINCPVCQGSSHKSVFPISDGELLRCRHCNFVFYNPRPTEKWLKDFYNSISHKETYSDSPMSSAEFAQKRYDSFLNVLASRAGKTIESSSRQLLDVGCGTGEFLSVSSRDGWEVKGVEMSSDSTEIAAKKVGSQNVVCGDIYSPKLANRKFDIITSYHVIEHLLDPLSFLKQSYLLLKEGGVIFLETPNFGSFGARVRQGNWSQIKPPQHISFFTPFSLLFSLKKAGFQRTQTFTVAPTVIESTRELPPVIRALGDLTYEILPLFNMGATLQAIAFKD